MTPDPFPNELVEAVEEACTIIENRCGTVRGIGPAMREALSVVLPLIEQRVIDRLAREAGEDVDMRDRAWEYVHRPCRSRAGANHDPRLHDRG